MPIRDRAANRSSKVMEVPAMTTALRRTLEVSVMLKGDKVG